MPEFDFDTYLGALMPRKLNDTESVFIYALPYYQKLTNLLKGTKKRFVGVLGWDMQMGNRFSKPKEIFVIFQGAGQLHPVEIHPPPT